MIWRRRELKELENKSTKRAREPTETPQREPKKPKSEAPAKPREVSEEIKEALGCIRFPAGFDSRELVVALRAAAKAGRNSKAKIPSKWLDKFHFVSDSKVS